MLNAPLTKVNDAYLINLFWGFASLIFFSIASSVLLENYYLALIPPFAIFCFIFFLNYKILFYTFLLVLPFSIELYMPGGLGTDVPTEPIALSLTIAGILYFLTKKTEAKSILNHPITIILFFHFCWIGFSAIFSQNMLISIKYLLAKTWYIIPFYFLPFTIWHTRKDIDRCFKILIYAASIAMLIILIKHAILGFTFETINKAAHPIYRNHVMYAALITTLLPFVWYFSRKKNNLYKKGFWYFLMIYFLAAIYLTYTRAAHISIILIIITFFVVKWRLVKIAVMSTLLMVTIGMTWIVHNNTFMDFAPDFEKTITHNKFDNLIEATYKMEDISTMERVYRWVAGYYMVKEKPLIGFGPACFYSFYDGYTMKSFETYVSDNPEKSGIHNYFLMILVEQGPIGLLIILFLCIFPIIRATDVYHSLIDLEDKRLLMASILSLIVIDAMLLINDLIETDKVGTIFFMCLAIITYIEIYAYKKHPKRAINI